jgi:hypothetical protein
VLTLPSGSAETAIANATAGVTVTDAAACTRGFAALAAVMVATVLLVTLGATKAPLLEIVPTLADQVTLVFAVPLIKAVNCSTPSEVIEVPVGEIESVTVGALAETTICTELDPECVCSDTQSTKL